MHSKLNLSDPQYHNTITFHPWEHRFHYDSVWTLLSWIEHIGYARAFRHISKAPEVVKLLLVVIYKTDSCEEYTYYFVSKNLSPVTVIFGVSYRLSPTSLHKGVTSHARVAKWDVAKFPSYNLVTVPFPFSSLQ